MQCQVWILSSTICHRRVALTGHELWATWAAKALGAQLHSSLLSDPAMSAHIPLRNWTETVVKHVRCCHWILNLELCCCNLQDVLKMRATCTCK